MRVLAVSDVPADEYYDFYRPGCLDEFDLILSCGDLDATYLEFLVTMAHCPLVYVRGNHDDDLNREPPEGCDCAEDAILEVKGLRILGLGGSMRPDTGFNFGENLYSEGDMRWRVRRLWRQLRKHGGFDVLLAHSPARGLNDLDDLPHQGYECFNELLERYRPKAFVHGHVHRSYSLGLPQTEERDGTLVVNAYDHCVFDLPDPPAGARTGRSRWRRRS